MFTTKELPSVLRILDKVFRSWLKEIKPESHGGLDRIERQLAQILQLEVTIMAKTDEVLAEQAAIKATVAVAVKLINDLQAAVAAGGLTPAQEDAFLGIVKQARADLEEAFKEDTPAPPTPPNPAP